MFFYPSCDSLITYFSVCNFQGGFDYKKAIVDTIIVIIEENSEAKEAGTIKVALCVVHTCGIGLFLASRCVFVSFLWTFKSVKEAESFQCRVCSLGCLGLRRPLRNS